MKKRLNKDINKTSEIVLIISILSIFFIAMFLASGFTSPLYPYYFGGDSAIFSLIGKGIIEGKILYKDLFDHKGPIMFFIQAIGYCISGHLGIFFVQCIFGAINIIFLYLIWKEIRKKEEKLYIIDLIAIFIAGYSIFFYTFEKGNLTEEFSLPFISGSIYFFIRYAMNVDKNTKHPYSYSMLYGAFIAILAFIRMNNATTIFAGILSIIIYLIYKKEFKNLFINMFFGILGCAIVTIPIILYFYCNDALYDMFYATFIYNFKYAGTASHQSIFMDFEKYIILYAPLIVSSIFGTVNILKKNNNRKIEFADILIGIIILTNFILLIITNKYSHYFTIFIPIYMLVISKYWTFNIKAINTWIIIICIILNINMVKESVKETLVANYEYEYNQTRHKIIQKDINNNIPDQEKDNVIGYNISAEYYWHTGLIPCYKYYTFQEWWSESDPKIQIDFMKYLREKRPLWLLASCIFL